MQINVVLVAGGSGTRMQARVPKQFLPLLGQPLFVHTIKVFQEALPQARLVLVLPQAHINNAREMLAEAGIDSIVLVAGGDSRYQSVKNGLVACTETGLVLVHDAVRCLASVELIVSIAAHAEKTGNAVPAVDCTDTPRMILPDGKNVSVDRSQLKLVQTPQAFEVAALRQAMQADYRPEFTDEASIMEMAGTHIQLVKGEHTNIKITHPLDLVLASQILETRRHSAHL